VGRSSDKCTAVTKVQTCSSKLTIPWIHFILGPSAFADICDILFNSKVLGKMDFDGDEFFDAHDDDEAVAKKVEMHLSEHALEFNIEILKFQIQLIYSKTAETHGEARAKLDEWLTRDVEVPLTEFSNLKSVEDRLVLRAKSIVLKGTLGEVATLEIWETKSFELLRESPFMEKPKDELCFVHQFLEMDTSQTQSCVLQFLKSKSLVVKLAPLFISWDNSMADRMNWYLPRSDSVKSTSSSETDFMDVSIVSPKALVIIRVPNGVQDRRWKNESLVLNMTDVNASTVHVDEQETEYAFDNMRRTVIWESVVNFSYARACIIDVMTGVVPWDLDSSDEWTITVGASSDINNTNVSLPKIYMSTRVPLVNADEILEIVEEAFLVSDKSKRAFKNRVFQRRGNFNSGYDQLDPAGDHGLDKDAEPPIHVKIDRTITHGYSTSESCVRLICPTATMVLDKMRYHSLNATLQLIVATIPTFTQLDSIVHDNDLAPALAPKKVDPASFWEGGDELCGDSEFDEFSINRRKPALYVFQMESTEGKVEIIDACKPSYVFEYFGVQVTLVDEKTTVESQDITLLEIKPNGTTPVLYSTKWGRTTMSPPLMQVFFDCTSDTVLLNISVEGLTLRYEGQSDWLTDIGQFFTSVDASKVENDSSTYTELTVEFFDSVVQYTAKDPHEAEMRNDALLACSLLRISANIAKPAAEEQSYQLTARDLRLFLSNDAAPSTGNDFKCTSLLLPVNPNPYSSIEDFCNSMLYAKMCSLNMAEFFLRFRDENVDVEVSVPQLDLYTCMDSLATANQLFVSLLEEMQPLESPHTGLESHAVFDEAEDDIDCLIHAHLHIDDRVEENKSSTRNEIYQDDSQVVQPDSQEGIQTVENSQFAPDEIHQDDSQVVQPDTQEGIQTVEISQLVPGGIHQDDTQVFQSDIPEETQTIRCSQFVRDDEMSAAELRRSYRELPDDQLSGAQLRARKQAQEDPDGVLVDGFLALDDDGMYDVTSLGSIHSPPPAPSGGWFATKIAAADNVLIWGDNAEEIELEEIQYHQDDDLLGESQIVEERGRELEERERAMDDFVSMCNKEKDSPAHTKEPMAKWYADDVKIYPHYMGVPYEAGPGSHVPPSEALSARLETSAHLAASEDLLQSRFIVRDLSVKWLLFDGKEWNQRAVEEKPQLLFQQGESEKRRIRDKGAGRNTNKSLEIRLNHMSACYDQYTQVPQSVSWLVNRTYVAIRDFEVIDHIPTSDINKMFCEWVSESRHPRITGSSMIRFAHDVVCNDGETGLGHSLRVAILPLKVNLDQDSIDFMLDFFALSQVIKESQEEEEEEDDDDDIYVIPDLPETPVLSAVDIRPFKIRVDYSPKRVSLSGLMEGDRMALVNLFAYEGLEVSIRRVYLEDVRGFHKLMLHVSSSWQDDVSRQRHKCLAGVSFPPINTVASLGNGLTNLVMIPLEQYQRDGRLVHGVHRGTSAFVRTVAIEFLGTISKAAQTTQSLLEHARDVITPQSRNPSYFIADPKDFTEGLGMAADSFKRELKQAAYVLVALPVEEFRNSGATDAFKSVLRGVPIAVIRPLLGATLAVSSTLIGLRNSVDPDIQVAGMQKYKSNVVEKN